MPAPKDPEKYILWIKRLSNSKKKFLSEHPEFQRGENNHMYNKHHSLNTTIKISGSCKKYYGEHPEIVEEKSKQMKGSNNHMFGKKQPKEVLVKSSESHKKYYAEHPEAIVKFREIVKKYYEEHPEFNKGENHPMYHYIYSKETIFKMSESHMGENNSAYVDGSCLSLYHSNFNESFKQKIRDRDNHQCQICFILEEDKDKKLDVHHIHYDKDNDCNNDADFVSLCTSCHAKIQWNREFWEQYFMVGMLLIA